MNKLFIIANWKCNPVSKKEAEKLFNLIKKNIKFDLLKDLEVVVCPPFVYLPILNVKGSKIVLGSQDSFWKEKGAYTGEISPLMLKDMGAKYVILGHSERRKYFQESVDVLNKKIKMVLKVGLTPILCIDNIDQLKGVNKDVIIAYEPLFAIGSGKPCNLEEAKRMRKLIKQPNVLYGGSVTSKNALSYIKVGYQGLLLGGSSLDFKEFTSIVKSFKEYGS